MKVQGFSDLNEVTHWLGAREGRLAFDVGANGGAVANLLAARFDKVVAFEPAEESYHHLRLDAWDNVVPVKLAVSDHEGRVTLAVTDKAIALGELVTIGTDSLAAWGQKLENRAVDCRTLDSLARTYGMPDLVKVDVEGHEVEVLAGAAEVLHGRPDLCVEIHSAGNGEKIRSLLEPLYELREIRHPPGSVAEHAHTNHYWLLGEG